MPAALPSGPPPAPPPAPPSGLPWKIIAILAAAALPLMGLALLTGASPAQPLIGFISGLLACLAVNRRWAFAAPVISVLAYLAMLLLPLPAPAAICAMALILSGLMVAGVRIGAAQALGQATFGWVYLSLVPGMTPDPWLMTLFVLGGVAGTGTAIALGVESFRRTAVPGTSGAGVGVFLALGAGFVFSIAAALALDLPQGYWIPFVFLQVAMAADTRHPAIALQRISGAVLGIALAGLIADTVSLSGLRLLVVAAATAWGLRVLPVRPVLSRALMTGAVVVLLAQPGDHSAAEHRLLAEVLGVLSVLLGSALYVVLAYLGARMPSRR